MICRSVAGLVELGIQLRVTMLSIFHKINFTLMDKSLKHSPMRVPKPCDLFVSSDGKGATQIKNNTISFSDGGLFEYPLKVAIVTVGGKPYYKWMALENKDVVVYQKPY